MSDMRQASSSNTVLQIRSTRAELAAYGQSVLPAISGLLAAPPARLHPRRSSSAEPVQASLRTLITNRLDGLGQAAALQSP